MWINSRVVEKKCGFVQETLWSDLICGPGIVVICSCGTMAHGKGLKKRKESEEWQCVCHCLPLASDLGITGLKVWFGGS